MRSDFFKSMKRSIEYHLDGWGFRASNIFLEIYMLAQKDDTR